MSSIQPLFPSSANSTIVHGMVLPLDHSNIPSLMDGGSTMNNILQSLNTATACTFLTLLFQYITANKHVWSNHCNILTIFFLGMLPSAMQPIYQWRQSRGGLEWMWVLNRWSFQEEVMVDETVVVKKKVNATTGKCQFILYFTS